MTEPPRMRGRVLAIAGSDSGGGAGIQADLKTLTAVGCYGLTAITALTVQDTRAIYAIHPVLPALLRLQIEHALADPGADAVKTGMLGDGAAVAVVAEALAGRSSDLPLVVDPVLAATSGERLLDAAGLETMKRRLFPMAALLTPNVPEAEALTGMRIADAAGMRSAAEALLALGAGAVLVKGGHLAGATVCDVLATHEGVETFTMPRIATRHTHGTGCTLASAIAAGLAQSLGLREAVCRARAYVHQAIESAPGFGAGAGPLNHAVTMDPARIALWRNCNGQPPEKGC